ncbi:MAG TPA: ClpXP protease specificity-enhancing factor SspB [Candidatus Limnocylindrales bacterium]|nr:ClpXP protease specificity-enhancing factor SspB [Candidatus Limnocylindrales bacterium]
MSPEEEIARGFLEAMSMNWAMLVAVDTTHPELVIPQYLKDRGTSAVLEYGLDMPIPINDLEVTTEGIRATLSFGREPHATFVPWRAVLGFRAKPLPGSAITSAVSADLPAPPPADTRPTPRHGLRAIGPEEIYSAPADEVAEAIKEAGGLGRPIVLRVVN